MKSPIFRLAPVASALAFAVASFAHAQTAPVPVPALAPASYPALPSETPAEFAPVTSSFNYVKRTVMVPMRDGVKLNTVIIIPRNAKGAPVLLTRTPYDASGLTSHAESSDMMSILQGYDNAADVIVEGGDNIPGGAGRARQVRLRRRLRDEPTPRRRVQPDPGRPFDRHLGHHRVADQEPARIERQGRHHRHFV